MYFKEYDIIVDTLESNVEADLNDVLIILNKQLGMTSGKIESVFKDCHPKDITLNNYFKDRKAYRTMEAILANPDKAKEEVALDFGYTGYTVFFRWFKKIYGKNPTEVISSNEFIVPPVIHVKEIIENDENLNPNRVTKRKGSDQMDSERKLVDKITYMRNRISELEKELRSEKDKERLRETEGTILKLKSIIAEDETRLDIHMQEPVVIKSLTPGLYAEFIKIEECRAIYGIGIRKIIELYNESVEHNIPLDELCDMFSELVFLSDVDDYYDEDDYLYEYEDPDMSYLVDEMSLAESWQYYNDDDAIDPYAGIEEPEEYY